MTDLSPDDATLAALLDQAEPGPLRAKAAGMLRRSAAQGDTAAPLYALLAALGQPPSDDPLQALARALRAGAGRGRDEEIRAALRIWATARVTVCNPRWRPERPRDQKS